MTTNELIRAVKRAVNIYDKDVDQYYFGLKCVECKSRNTKFICEGKFKCMSCATEFSTRQWMRLIPRMYNEARADI